MEIAKVIETNLAIQDDNTIIDHQSRVIEVSSWDEYVAEIESKTPIYRESYIGNMHGSSISKDIIVYEFRSDEQHLTCSFVNSLGETMMKLAYLISE